jgi:hypothetical protein
MPLDPHLVNKPGSQRGTVQALADLNRKVNKLLARSQIGQGSITHDVIATGTITAAEIDAGTITALLVSGAVITAGGPSPNPRVVIDSTGIKGYTNATNKTFEIDATTGLLTCTGVLGAQSGSNLPVAYTSGYLPGSANRYSNSAFQNGAGTYDTTGWTITNATASSGGTTVPPVYGVLTLKLVATATSNVTVQPTTIADSSKRVVPGISYTLSHYVYPATNADQSRVDIKWYDSSSTLLSTTTGTAAATTINTWNRISTTAAAPSNAAYAIGVHYIATTCTSSDNFYVECLQMEEGDRASAWAPKPDEILVNQVNANNINVANLSAINANLGSITAGTITGGTLQTAASGARTYFNSTGFAVNDGTNDVTALNHYNGVVLTSNTAGSLGSIIDFNKDSVAGTNLGLIEHKYQLSPNNTYLTITTYPTTGIGTPASSAYLQLHYSDSSTSLITANIEVAGSLQTVTLLDSTGATNVSTFNARSITSAPGGLSPASAVMTLTATLSGPTYRSSTITSDTSGNLVFDATASVSALHEFSFGGTNVLTIGESGHSSTQDITIDHGSGTHNAVLTLVGRSGGTGYTSTISCSNLAIGINHPSFVALQVNSNNAVTMTTTAVTVGATSSMDVNIGGATSQKLGFYGHATAAQAAGNTDVTVSTAGATNTVFRNTSFTGGSGNAYTIGGIVAALKAIGILG